MARQKALRIHYPPTLLERARSGQHNFSNRLRTAFEDAGWTLDLVGESWVSRRKTQALAAHSITHAIKPLPKRSLVMRRAYLGAFWRLEATEKRWEFDVALKSFVPDGIDPERAKRVTDRWAREVFAGADNGHRGTDYLLMALQGRLLDHRSFQTMAPTQMIDATCRANPGAKVVATLHPGIDYRKDELAALDMLEARHPGFVVSKEPTLKLMKDCSAIVCQNSAVALSGFLIGKPAVLFGRSDFHHIASNVHLLGVDGAFEHLRDNRPDFPRYLYWFFRENAINAGSDLAETQILSAARRAGWPV